MAAPGDPRPALLLLLAGAREMLRETSSPARRIALELTIQQVIEWFGFSEDVLRETSTRVDLADPEVPLIEAADPEVLAWLDKHVQEDLRRLESTAGPDGGSGEPDSAHNTEQLTVDVVAARSWLGPLSIQWTRRWLRAGALSGVRLGAARARYRIERR